ncbi:MAG: hypothetical protein AAGA35_03835 [Patescibacteria group bacterium]
MTLTKDIAAKASVAFVAIAMVFTLFAPAAQAQSEAELQQMINDLLAQVSSLQGQLGQGGDSMGSSAGVCPFSWTRDLTTGATGNDVMALQQFLNADPDTRVAASGVGSAGAETDFFGGLTASAVSKFQVKYRSDVLSPAGLVNPTGYFGPSSRAKANMLCSSAPAGDDMMDDDMMDDDMSDDEDEDEDDDDNDGPLQGAEAELEELDVDDAEDDDIEEGKEDQVVAEIDVEFEDGDARIERLDLEFSLDTSPSQPNAEDEPWETFETVSIWIDGDKVAEEPADDEDDWLDDELTMRITGIDTVAREDDQITILVAVSTQNGIDFDTNDQTNTWTMTVPSDGLRFEDATGDDVREGPTDGTSASFNIEEEGAEDELFVRSSSNDPDATTVELEDDENSDYITIFEFDLDTEDSENDIEMETIRVDVAATEDGTVATSTSFLIDDAQLVIDGEIFDDVSIRHDADPNVPDTTDGQFVFDVEDEDLFIDAGDRVSVQFQVEFEALPANFEGATVEATTDASVGYEAEGGDDLSGSQFSGAATGEEHTLRTEGAILEPGSMDETLKINDDQDLNDDEGEFEIKFDVTAFESDIFVNKTAASGTALGTAGVNFLVEDNSGNQVLAGTSSASLTSTADTEGTRFQVEEGETEEFTLTVEYDPTAAGFFQLQLFSLNFAVTNADPTTQQRALDESDYETDALSI